MTMRNIISDTRALCLTYQQIHYLILDYKDFSRMYVSYDTFPMNNYIPREHWG